jgi:hypothetical protein
MCRPLTLSEGGLAHGYYNQQTGDRSARLERIEALLQGRGRAELTRMEPLDMDDTG